MTVVSPSEAAITERGVSTPGIVSEFDVPDDAAADSSGNPSPPTFPGPERFLNKRNRLCRTQPDFENPESLKSFLEERERIRAGTLFEDSGIEDRV
ncbi:hypothetical protein [Streptosporangium carneum]|nr:hypothetical protein [Streptosporangium carneum]